MPDGSTARPTWLGQRIVPVNLILAIKKQRQTYSSNLTKDPSRMAKPQPRPYISSGNVLQRYHSSLSSCYLSLTPIASESSTHSASPQLHRGGIRIPRSLRHDTILRALIVKSPLVEMAINHCL